MSNRDENTGATPTRPSTSVSSSMSGGTSGATARQSLLPSPDTSTMIIDDLAYDSGSDDEMSIEAKRVLRRKKLEREKLQKLGMYNLSSSRDPRTGQCRLVRHFSIFLGAGRFNYDKES